MTMRKSFFAALALVFIGSAGAASAQNRTCPTAPNGDASNKCASTQFVKNSLTTALPLTSNHIYVGNASNVATDVAPGTGFVASGGILNLNGAQLASIGGVNAIICATHQWLNTIAVGGAPACFQPAIGDISGLGTGIIAALANNVGSAGAPVLFNGALGTPSSGIVGTGVTLGGVTMGLGSDATGDIYYNNGGVFTRLAIGSSANVLTVSAGKPAWVPATGGGNVSNTGTPTNGQIAQFTNATTVQGITTVPSANGGAGSINGALKANGSGVTSQAATSDLSDVVAPTTWTPSDQSGATLTFTTVTALYTRLGKHVVAQFRLTFPSTASGATAAIGGLPVASSSSGATFSAGSCTSTITSGGFIIGVSMAANTSVLNFNSTATSPLLNSTISTFTLTCTISYISN